MACGFAVVMLFVLNRLVANIAKVLLALDALEHVAISTFGVDGIAAGTLGAKHQVHEIWNVQVSLFKFICNLFRLHCTFDFQTARVLLVVLLTFCNS